MDTIGLIYGSDTGMTEEVTHNLIDISNLDIDVIEAEVVKKSDFNRYNKLILGLSTWYDGDLQSDWENFFDEFETIDFSGKTVALYGLGDQYGYGEYFIDGVGILATTIIQNGGTVIGKWPIEGYDFTESKAKIEEEDLFYGLALDEDNQPELTGDRLQQWVAQIEEEFDN
ncbi:flavodoxin [Tenacibaculum amylolyticum]|uniref:flavodoxin n=1 Tax=Tenacibaculum amylolyticum TaxID=104269 RepID=UPI0038934651